MPTRQAEQIRTFRAARAVRAQCRCTSQATHLHFSGSLGAPSPWRFRHTYAPRHWRDGWAHTKSNVSAHELRRRARHVLGRRKANSPPNQTRTRWLSAFDAPPEGRRTFAARPSWLSGIELRLGGGMLARYMQLPQSCRPRWPLSFFPNGRARKKGRHVPSATLLSFRWRQADRLLFPIVSWTTGRGST